MKQIRYWIPSIIWGTCIITASLVSSGSLKKFQIETIFEIDKIIHIGMYFGLSLVLSYGFYYSQKIVSKKRLLLITFIISSLVGVLMEILQSTITSSRSFDYFDIIANIIGAFIGSALFLIRIK